ncbi:MAG: 30S ribosomal protein S2 [Patescibacteria group bacterium]
MTKKSEALANVKNLKDKETAKAVKGFKVKLPTVDELLEAGVHFGHQARRWHPKMEEFIFDKRKDIHILDLYKSHELLENACKYMYDVASKGGNIIFVGTKRQARDIVELEAKRAGVMYVTERWVGGTLTNFQTLKKNIDKLKDYMKKRDAGELSKYTKKERLLIDREIEKLRVMFGGLVNLAGVPDALFMVDVRKEKTAVREAKRLSVPVVALVDTNSDPAGVSFVIPGNDDAIRSIALMVKAVADSVEAGYKKFAQLSDKTEEKPEEEEEDKTLEPIVTGTQSSELLEVAADLEEKLIAEVEEELKPVVPIVPDVQEAPKLAEKAAKTKKKVVAKKTKPKAK